MKDLCLLVADLNMSQALEAALQRYESLNIRSVEFDIKVHPERDGGMRTTGPQLLSLQKRQYTHGLIILDYEGSGTQFDTAVALEEDLDRQLEEHWQSNAKAIVIEPELDIWMWGSDNALRDILGWSIQTSLREWLHTQNFNFQQNGKPERPKEALERILLELKRPRSSAIYRDIAKKISLQRCEDNAFIRLRNTLVSWFSATHSS